VPDRDSTAQTVALSAEAANLGSVDQRRRRAEILSINADTLSRAFMVVVIAAIFIWLNWEVMRLVSRAFDQDMQMMQKFPQTFKPSDRVVTPNVFMSLIGATVVQVGIATVAIVSYLFPKKPGS